MNSTTSKTAQVLEALSDVKDRTLETQNNLAIPVTAGKCETHTTKMQGDDGQQYIKDWLSNPLMKKLAKHTAAQDETSQINELGAKILDYGKVATIGRQICSLHYTAKEALKIRLPKEGKAKKTAGDTWSINTRGQRNEYVEVKTERFLDAGDTWTTAQIEDTEYDYLMAQTQESMYNLAKLESQIIIAKFKTLQGAAGIAGKVAKSGDHDDINMNTLIQLRGKLADKERMVKAYVMSENTLTNLLEDEKLQDSQYLTSGSYDYETGQINATFLGARFIPSTLMEDNVVWAVDTNVAMLYVLRRDSLIEPFSKVDSGEHGIRITSRYGLEFGRKDAFAYWGV